MKRKEIPLSIFIAAGIPVLLASIVLSIAFGAVSYDPGDILKLFALRLGIIKDAVFPAGMETAVLMIRMPRVMSAVVAGAGVSSLFSLAWYCNVASKPEKLGVM